MKNAVVNIESFVATEVGIKSYMHCGYDVKVFDCLKSTNLTAREIAKEKDKANFVIVAREQTAGRGRFERKFFSPKDCGVYFSVVIKPQSSEEILFITPLVALAVADAIREICQKDAKIKWVNDIYVDDKKCCGILCQSIADEKNNIDKIVLGIGINLYSRGIDAQIADIACAVGDGVADVANKLVATVVDNIDKLHKNFNKENIVKRYRNLSFLQDKEVIVAKGDDKKCAIVKDIDENCNLVVKYQDENIEHLSTGEVKIIW